MKKNILIRSFAKLAFLATCLLIITYMIGCNYDDKVGYSTTSDVNMTAYFEQRPEEFSEFSKMLEITETAGFLSAYGLYTCFAPTNEAIVKFLQEKGKSSIEEIDPNELKDIVKYVLLKDTISTSKFTDGKLPILTMYGQYLTTGARVIDGEAKSTDNKQANIIRKNVIVGNGIIHVIDKVIEPPRLTLAQMLNQMDEYSIFSQALKETGLSDTLNKMYSDNTNSTRRWFTVVAQSNSVFNKYGIASYEMLKDKLSQTGNPQNVNDSLYLFMAYHCLKDIKYLADIVGASSHATLAPLEVITTELRGDSIIVNEATFNGVLEKGVLMNRFNSDYSATNGVLHSLSGDIRIKIRKPVPLYWDVTDQPELRLMTNIFRKTSQSTNLTKGQLKDITWDGGNSTGDIKYFNEGPTTSNLYCYDDGLFIRLRTAAVKWIEFTTPLLIKGKYKIWVCQRRSNGGVFQGFLDAEPLSKTFNANDYGLVGGTNTPEVAESQGYKTYANSTTNSVHYGRLLGTIEIKTTDRHKFKLVALDNNSAGINLDMIHFIPVEMDQLWPKFNRDGSKVEKHL